jgi:hypothetical protein
MPDYVSQLLILDRLPGCLKIPFKLWEQTTLINHSSNEGLIMLAPRVTRTPWHPCDDYSSQFVKRPKVWPPQYLQP